MRLIRDACRLGSIGLALILLAAPSGARAGGEADMRAALERLAVGDHRAPGHAARNVYRHPVETLMWFGLEPDMTVVEIWPGGAGWYAEIIAPFVNERGAYYAAGFVSGGDNTFFAKSNARFRAKLDAHPELYGNARVTEFGAGTTEIAPPGSADMVLMFRNLHDWMDAGFAQEAFDAMYRALRPGGILGLVEHRGDPALPQDARAESGYVREGTVIGFAEAAGFALAGRSEINANPLDTKDYPAGVWTLPPTLRLGDRDRAKYLAIGESDRMTLKFVKPAGG